MKYASIAFKWNPDKTYDYKIPAGIELQPGDKVMVETKHGAKEVEVVEIKAESDKADKEILRRADPAPAEPAPAATKSEWDF
ncbi:DUF5839 family protein [Rhizobium rhizogenes]|uniref:DUF5839 family protein n=1 Tax=Rhizobium rhizogenes TaxID=359 RepID=UPI00068B308C|nr:DUF5839 family protein [Rhizobium rhizogenes]NTI80395.1 hypothetical protein [Rhizobium rhizogenes]NTJ22581.1 hypothetical protein [Rhizobium rhizogenes]QUE81287.1 hypothetical protein EML492_05625 [Rhizobium rhizogenes]TQO80613.1 hypothetical protein FFE80_05795 [Rhizobium rhizogenes]TRB52572.1 hypothetical protein EXN69_23295 [Rhizobium rhizogenes]